MRHNLPISNVEYALPEGDVIITRTDLDGNIVYANDAFLRASGYSRDEVLGEPQNIVRHPEMPALAFADMWATVRSNRPWAGIVKNRRKDGGFYWVAANVTPLFEAGRKVGYMSVRTTPSRVQIVAATRLYAKLNGQPRTQIRIAGCAVLRSGLAGMLDRLLRLPVAWRLCFIMSTLIVLFLVQALSANHSWLPGLTAPQQTGLLAAVGVALCAASAIYLIHHVLLPLRQLNDAARAVLFGQIRSAFPERGDEQTKILGRMLNQMSRTQSLEIGEINTAIEQVAELTQRNAALVDEAAAAAGNVQRQAQALEDAVAAFELRTHSMPVTMEKRALPSHDRLC
jgi:aerotaxis receptor